MSAGLYIHVPFCARACPYCDFDFEVGRPGRSGPAVERWLSGLERERRTRDDLEREWDTLYFGGGTPSMLEPDQLRSLFAWLRERLGVETRALRELTFELNPEHADDARLDALVELGVGRVSLGVQALVDDGLRELGRAHTRASAITAIERCTARGIQTSADLILGWRGQGPTELVRDIAELTELGVEHVSIYGLTIEPGTAWPKLVRRGLRILPDEDIQAELLQVAETELEARGLHHYEVASYARPRAEAIHNSKYWTWADVIGLGPSAASVEHTRGHTGELVVTRRSNPRGLEAWAEGADPSIERLTGVRGAAEGLWLGLRRLRGIDVAGFVARFGVDRAWLEARVVRQVELGNLEWAEQGTILKVGAGRWLWHDEIGVAVVE